MQRLEAIVVPDVPGSISLTIHGSRQLTVGIRRPPAGGRAGRGRTRTGDATMASIENRDRYSPRTGIRSIVPWNRTAADDAGTARIFSDRPRLTHFKARRHPITFHLASRRRVGLAMASH